MLEEEPGKELARRQEARARLLAGQEVLSNRGLTPGWMVSRIPWSWLLAHGKAP